MARVHATPRHTASRISRRRHFATSTGARRRNAGARRARRTARRLVGRGAGRVEHAPGLDDPAGCSSALPEQDTASARFRIDIIRVPLAHPDQAAIVSRPRIFEALVEPAQHGASEADLAEAKREADSARATGAFVVTFQGLPVVAPPSFTNELFDSIVKSRGATAATAADSTALRGALQGIVDKMFLAPMGPGGVRHGPDQCHDITVFPAMGVAGGA